jgi:formylglycine-generating enzyme
MRSRPFRTLLASLLGTSLASLVAAGCFPDFPEVPAGDAGAAGAPGAGGNSGAGATGGGPSAGAGGSSGAGPEALGQSCAQDSECPGLICLYGYCRTPCSSDDACPKGAICLGSPAKGACSLVGDGDGCPSGACSNGDLACGIDRRCRVACGNGVGCQITGQQCIAGTCVSTLEDGFSTTWGSCSPEGATCGGADGKTIALCNVQAPGVVLAQSCDTVELCKGGLKNVPPTCASSGCPDGDYRCSGVPAQQLEKCNAQKTAYEPVADCGSSSLCTASVVMGLTKCADAKCGPAATPPTDTNRCQEGNAEVCDGAQYAETPCNGQQCNPATATCFTLDIDDTEVTREDYETFQKTAPSQSGVCTDNPLAPDPGCLADPSVCDSTKGDCSKHPQVCVDWCDARAYCESKGRTLCGTVGKPLQMVPIADFYKPGASAWMNACSSGGQYTWTHGNTWDQNTEGQYCDGSSKQKGANGSTFDVGTLGNCHSPVAAYKSIKDLSGSVAEWENACARLDDAPDASLNDSCRVRGGSFSDTLGGKPDLRCDADAVRPRSTVSPFIGFRCCGKQ